MKKKETKVGDIVFSSNLWRVPKPPGFLADLSPDEIKRLYEQRYTPQKEGNNLNFEDNFNAQFSTVFSNMDKVKAEEQKQKESALAAMKNESGETKPEKTFKNRGLIRKVRQ